MSLLSKPYPKAHERRAGECGDTVSPFRRSHHLVEIFGVPVNAEADSDVQPDFAAGSRRRGTAVK